MSDDTDGLFEELAAHQAAKEAKHAKALAEMFTPLFSICRDCGVLVVSQEQHLAFHDGIRNWTADLVKEIEKHAEYVDGRVTDTRDWVASLEERLRGGAA